MRSVIAILILGLAATAEAQFDSSVLPTDADWYFHANFETMRTTRAGQPLYARLQDEAFDEVREELAEEFDVDLNTEFDAFTTYGDRDGRFVAIMQGPIDAKSRQQLIAALQKRAPATEKRSDFGTYFEVDATEIREQDYNINTDKAYVSFAREDAVIFGTDPKYFFRALGGEASGGGRGTMLVLTANREFIQVGVNAEAMESEGALPWNSGLLQETRQIAFVLGDTNGQLDFQLNITANDPSTTEALANVVRGLIGLQALSSDANDEFKGLLSSLKIDNDSRGLTMRLLTDPDELIRAMED
ncbi:MAG: hypothetical protein AAGF46_01170 [Pseudomonadota bacterium]